MDANAALTEFRRLMAEAQKLSDEIAKAEANGKTPASDLFYDRDDLRVEAADLMAGLDKNLSKGGSLPKEWGPRHVVVTIDDGWIVTRTADLVGIVWYSNKDPDCEGMAQRYCTILNGFCPTCGHPVINHPDSRELVHEHNHAPLNHHGGE